jgi:dynein heavy chain
LCGVCVCFGKQQTHKSPNKTNKPKTTKKIYCVLSAIRERKRAFVFTDGSTVSLDPRVGFFITMNPGYAGRQELPENLKALFRGVTMMVPNRQIIIKVKLAACGYQENDVLSKKFFVLYGLCEQQLSKQPHYDFGLRNILSVLRTAGASKRANPDKSEVYLLMRTLRDMNMSKYVAEDVPLFMSLIDDLFPGLKAERAAFPEVTRALERAAAERGLQPHAPWLNKCIQLYETYLVRHGIMLVGPSGGGKTAITECLAAALTEMGQKHVIWRMNPKAITAPQMFGRMDPATGDWTDGVFAVLWRRAAKARTQSTWIALDGPVDAIWIENLNTVLDDNKVLTLANGDRILMTPAMRAMFEPENLNNASPATVSRAGIIYVSESELGWAPVAKSWLARRPDAAQAALLGELFDKYVPKLLEWLRVSAKPVMHNEQVCYVSTMLKVLSASLQKHDDAHDALPAARLERLFLYAAAWGLGGALDGRDRAALDATLRAAGAAMPPQPAEPDTLYEWFVDPATGEWRHWGDAVPAWEYPAHEERPKFAQLVIPTLDSVRYERLLSLMHSVGGASLLVGVPGTAKVRVVCGSCCFLLLGGGCLLLFLLFKTNLLILPLILTQTNQKPNKNRRPSSTSSWAASAPTRPSPRPSRSAASRRRSSSRRRSRAPSRSARAARTARPAAAVWSCSSTTSRCRPSTRGATR